MSEPESSAGWGAGGEPSHRPENVPLALLLLKLSLSLLKIKFNSPRTDLAKRKELSAPVFPPRECTLVETKRPSLS